MDQKYVVLRQTFGYTEFRNGQEDLIDAQLSGRDVLGIMPTGGGKSLCYQIPALLMEGITLVVSPLISLMKDQVMALKNAGIRAAYLNSSLTPEQTRLVWSNLRAGKYKIVYVAPERLMVEGFVSLAQNLNLSLVAVDEAHCISQWGQDFRPGYLKIAEFLERLPTRPVVSAFTATATPQVQEDIRNMLKLRDPLRVVTSFDRPNLCFAVIRQPANPAATALRLIRERKDKSGIVYCATRKAVDAVCSDLQKRGIRATRYHAGLDEKERQQNQEDFLYDRRRVMVATNAFGMGIDKSNVSFVIHYNMPQSLEAYYQEAGRAGRDGEKADCILLYSRGDIQTAKFLIQNSPDNEELTPEQQARKRQQDLRRLNAMVGYCTTTSCLRSYILNYFGQFTDSRCGNCGNCFQKFVETDITRPAQMMLSCVQRVRDQLGYAVGATLISGVLSGSREKRILELRLNRLSTYGLMKDTSRSRIREMLECLESQGYVRTDPNHGGMTLTERAGEVLFRGKTVKMRTLEQPKEKAPAGRPVSAAEKQGLYAVLQEVRARRARAEGVPAYIIFSNATLADMAAKAPQTMSEFLQVFGVGQVKAERHGKAFLEAIQSYRSGKE